MHEISETISPFVTELHFPEGLSQSPIEIKMIGVFDKERFRLFRFMKRHSDRERGYKENAIEC